MWVKRSIFIFILLFSAFWARTAKKNNQDLSSFAKQLVDDPQPVTWKIPANSAVNQRAANSISSITSTLGTIQSGISIFTTTMDYLQTAQDILTMTSMLSNTLLGGMGMDQSSIDAVSQALSGTQTSLNQVLSAFGGTNGGTNTVAESADMLNNLMQQMGTLTGALGAFNQNGNIWTNTASLSASLGGDNALTEIGDVSIVDGTPLTDPAAILAESALAALYAVNKERLKASKEILEKIAKHSKNEQDFYTKFIFSFICHFIVNKKIVEIEDQNKEIEKKINTLSNNKIMKIIYRDRIRSLMIDFEFFRDRLAQVKKDIPSVQQNLVLYESNFLIQMHLLLNNVLDLRTRQYLIQKKYDDFNLFVKIYATIKK